MYRGLLGLVLIALCGCRGPAYRVHESRADARIIKTLTMQLASRSPQENRPGHATPSISNIYPRTTRNRRPLCSIPSPCSF